MIDALRNIIDEGILALAPLVDLAQEPEGLKVLLEDLGWTPASLPRPLGEFAVAGADLVSTIGSDDVTSAAQALKAIKRLVDAINSVLTSPDSDFPSGIDIASFKETIGRDLLDYVVVEHMLRNRYQIGGLLKLAGLIRLVQTPARGLRQPYLKRQVPWNRLGELITDPVKGFREAFDWDSATPKLTQALGDLASLLENHGLRLSFFSVTGDLLTFVNAGATAPLDASFGIDLAFDENPDAPDGVKAGVRLLLRPPTVRRGAAISLLPYARLRGAQEVALSGTLSLSTRGDADFTKGVSITVGPDSPPEVQVGFLGGTAAIPAEIQASLKITPAPDETERILFGTPEGSRLSVQAVIVTAGTRIVPTDKLDAFVEVALENAHVVIKPEPGEADSFLASVIGGEGISVELSFGLRLSSAAGFHLTGSAGLEATLPVQARLGPIGVQAIGLGLKPSSQGVDLEIGATVSGSLGPLALIVDRAGFRLTTRFPDPPDGNLGPLDLGFGFLPPNRVGLSIDSAGVSGGGFLAHDDATHEYSGVLQLQFTDLALQAFGLITTQVAGRSGYSLLALIDADFPPVQLGWGFTLDGVGGLLAVNRAASTEALHAALKANTLSSILFPKNAITNAPQILSTLDAIFPTAPGRFIFGPMVLIGWGTPTVFTAAIAVVVELPEPILIILIARLSVRLPSESEALVRINLDALGVLDLSQNSLSLDAKLFDSKLLEFTLSGDMALRANWSSSSQREFLLAIGGFHPHFTPPAGFPALQRITIDMPSGPLSKLRLAAYLALTSNTVQFGATLDVFIGVSGFGLAGHLGFDALLQLDPFHFDADISGHVALTAGGDDLMSVGLEATLSGPAPWHVAGNFKVHIVFFDVHVSFSHSWGEDAPASQIAPVQVLPLLTAALADARNWGAALSAGTWPLVSLKDTGSQVVHPLARLEAHESVVPLRLAITRFGSAPAAGATTFAIGDYQVNGSTVKYEPIQDDFAPAQFFDLSDEEKLARPSFERHDAGVRLTGIGLTTSGGPVSKKISYETFYVDQPGVLRTDPGTPPKTFVLGELSSVLAIGASGRAAIRTAGDRRYTAPGTPIKVVAQSFVIANRVSLTFAGLGAPQGSYSDAAAALKAALAQNPARRGALQIVSSHEAVT